MDIRTPMAQTEEMYIALKQAGVETALVRMNQEWHGTGRKKNQPTGLELMDTSVNGMKNIRNDLF